MVRIPFNMLHNIEIDCCVPGFYAAATMLYAYRQYMPVVDELCLLPRTYYFVRLTGRKRSERPGKRSPKTMASSTWTSTVSLYEGSPRIVQQAFLFVPMSPVGRGAPKDHHAFSARVRHAPQGPALGA